MKREELDKIAIEIVNFLAEKKIAVGEMDYIFKAVENIVMFETKVKKIEV